MMKLRFANLFFALGVLLPHPIFGTNVAFASQQDFYSGTRTGGPMCNSKYTRDGKWYCPTNHESKTYGAVVIAGTDTYQVVDFKELMGSVTQYITTNSDDCNTHGSQNWDELRASLTFNNTVGITETASIGIIQTNLNETMSEGVSAGYAHTFVNSTDHRTCEGHTSTGSCTTQAGEHKILVMFDHVANMSAAFELEFNQYVYGSHFVGRGFYNYGWNKVPDKKYWFTLNRIVLDDEPFTTGVACIDYTKYHSTMRKGQKYNTITGYRRLQ